MLISGEGHLIFLCESQTKKHPFFLGKELDKFFYVTVLIFTFGFVFAIKGETFLGINHKSTYSS